ncbi:hypothetical protein [Amycolatopsis magusensis]|uniref:hypothetical protein n=1 Tax=Amycolatopsis magusensis TaxID=882444 RepID=UPI0024A83BA0|nr:hypothetical protein [Amycolatopsis magusensis]MDI5978243.1 hypothetical protein [Amycolatopsis magusensis]
MTHIVPVPRQPRRDCGSAPMLRLMALTVPSGSLIALVALGVEAWLAVTAIVVLTALVLGVPLPWQQLGERLLGGAE